MIVKDTSNQVIEELYCPACRTLSKKFYWQTNRLKGRKRIAWCPICEFGWQHPLPQKHEIYNHFNHSIYMIQSEIEKEKGFKRRIATLDKFKPNRGSLIDIGCGTGHFLLAARKSGWDVKGVEPHVQSAAFCKGQHNLDVTNDLIENLSFGPDFFDVITLWDVWEHVYDPIVFLDNCLNMLSPGGILAFSIPNASGFPARLFKGNWRYVMLTHLSYFTMNFVYSTMNKRNLIYLHADHTIKFQSLFQGFALLLGKNLDIERLMRLGRKGGIECSQHIPNAHSEALQPKNQSIDYLVERLRSLAFALNLVRFPLPRGDMVDFYYRKI